MVVIKSGKRATRKKENDEKSEGPVSSSKQFLFGAGILFLFCGMGAVQFGVLVSELLSNAGGVEYISITEEAKLKSVFFSGEPHVLYCLGNKTEGRPIPQMITQIAQHAAKDAVMGETKFVAANCFKKMSSGRTISERFSFGKNEGFIGIFANENTPKMLNYLQSPENVIKQLKPMLKVSLDKITYIKDWDETKHRKTFMILAGSTKSVITNMQMVFKPLVKKYRSVKTVSIDTSFWKIDTSEKFEKLAPPQSDKDFGDAICVTRIQEVDDGNAESGAVKEDQAGEAKKPKFLADYLTSWDGDDPARFMELCRNGGASGWSKLMRRPRVYARPTTAKVVKAPPRSEAATSEKTVDEGLKKGGKEKVGRRDDMEQDPVDDGDHMEDPPEEKEEDMEI